MLFFEVIHSSILYGCECEKKRIPKHKVISVLRNDFFDLCRDLGADYVPRPVFTQYARWGKKYLIFHIAFKHLKF